MSESDDGQLVCENCGEETHGPLIGGECVRKCSQSVPIDELADLAEELVGGGGYPTREKERLPYRTGVGRGKNRAGIEIKKLIGEYSEGEE